MHQVFIEGGVIRKLWSVETTAYRDHLLRLDPESRRNRLMPRSPTMRSEAMPKLRGATM